MNLTWLDPLHITPADWQLLCDGGKPGGWEPVDIAQHLLARRWLAFRCDVGNGAFAVEKIGRRLHVRVLSIGGFGWRMRAFRDVMDRLASDMECDTVETTVFDERLSRAMMRIRARPESWSMVWQVEGGARPLRKDD